MPRYDLHTHSTASDGTLTPAELVAEAAAGGVTHLALTDHDTIAGINEADRAAQQHGIHFIPGAEFSASWENKTLHIVGLNLTIASPELDRALTQLAQTRLQRAEQIAQRLDKSGVPGMLACVQALAGEGQITRSHFAQALVNQGYVRDIKAAFRRYLGQGKPAAVASHWPSMAETIALIHIAGGVAVLAHPSRYKLTRSWLQRLVGAFKQAGGDALEVVAGNATPTEINALAGWVRRHELAASAGSDYHGSMTPWLKPGRLMPLPDDLTPVWALWQAGKPMPQRGALYA